MLVVRPTLRLTQTHRANSTPRTSSCPQSWASMSGATNPWNSPREIRSPFLLPRAGHANVNGVTKKVSFSLSSSNVDKIDVLDSRPVTNTSRDIPVSSLTVSQDCSTPNRPKQKRKRPPLENNLGHTPTKTDTKRICIRDISSKSKTVSIKNGRNKNAALVDSSVEEERRGNPDIPDIVAIFDEFDAVAELTIKQVNKFDPLDSSLPFEQLSKSKDTIASTDSNDGKEEFKHGANSNTCWHLIKCHADTAAKMNHEIDQEWAQVAESLPFIPFSIMPLQARLELTKKLLDLQDQFRAEGRPFAVDVGYHNTLPSNLQGIQVHGLRNMYDRKVLVVDGKSRAPRGPSEQIFTGNNPYKFRAYGNVGLIAARLKGKTRRIRNDVGDSNAFEFECGVALETSEQCVAFFSYNVSETRKQITHNSTAGHDSIYYLHCMLQKIIDKYMNEGQPTFIEICVPDYMAVGHF